MSLSEFAIADTDYATMVTAPTTTAEVFREDCLWSFSFLPLLIFIFVKGGYIYSEILIFRGSDVPLI